MGKIVDVKIELRKWDRSIVHATFENGEEKDIIHFYSDEISFSRQELIGLTENQAKELYRKKDIAYLQS